MCDLTDIAADVRKSTLPTNPLLRASAAVYLVCDALARPVFDIRKHTEQQRRERGPDEVNGQPVVWR